MATSPPKDHEMTTLSPAAVTPAVATTTPVRPTRFATARRRLRGRPEDPRWVRPGLLALLAATGVLYGWGLGASGWANAFYSAAVQAGATSWKAFFFGSSDAANSITVDKTPAALWPMALAARVFGVNAWSILVPQALMGVGTVAALYATVRRTLGGSGYWSAGPAGSAAAGLLAGGVMALTPAAALMFRFNNPDALLVLLLTLGGYGIVRAQEHGGGRWLLLAAACVGTGFLAKMLQAFLVVPVFALVYLATAPGPLGRRLGRTLSAGVALLVSAGWWVAVVALWPAASRPYIGGSQHNSVLELALGYNGLGRLTGEETGGLGNLNQDAGWGRLFGSEPAGQISWLLPAAIILLVAGLWLTRRAPRTDPVRAGYLLWGGWLVVTALVFSFMQGIFHAYYTVALAPPIAGLVGMGAVALWQRRHHPLAATTLAVTTGVTAWWSYRLLRRTPDWYPWLGPAVLAAGIAAAALLVVAAVGTRRAAAAGPGHAEGARPPEAAKPGPTRLWARVPAGMAGVAATVAVIASVAGPAAYAIDTARTPHSGAIPSAGPSSGLGPGRGGPGGPDGAGGFAGGGPPAARSGAAPGGAPDGGTTGNRGPGPAGAGGNRPGGMGGPGGGGPGGLLGAATPSTALTALLKSDSASYTWAAATVGSNNAAGYQLAIGAPVMAVGGFNGTDPAPTLARFKEYVAAKKIHYFVGGGMTMRASSGSDQSRRIAEWVQAGFTARTVGGTTVYDLTAPVSSAATG